MLQLNARAPHGRWQIAAYIDPKADPVGRVQFDVADFVPQRLKVTLTPEDKLAAPRIPISMCAPKAASSMARRPAGFRAKARRASPPTPIPSRIMRNTSSAGWTIPSPTSMCRSTRAGHRCRRRRPTPPASIGDLADTTLPLKAHGQGLDPRAGRPHHRQDGGYAVAHPRCRHRHPARFRRRLGRRKTRRRGFEAIAARCQRQAHCALAASTYSWVREVTSYQWYQDNGSGNTSPPRATG